MHRTHLNELLQRYAGAWPAEHAIAARFRAFDSRTGKMVWETMLGASGHAMPLTYQGRDGKQYVSIIATGGSYPGSPSTTDDLVTYALP